MCLTVARVMGVVALGRGRVIKSDGHQYFFREVNIFHLTRGIRHVTDFSSVSLVRSCDGGARNVKHAFPILRYMFSCMLDAVICV